MNSDPLQIAEIWVYLSGSPLFALIITLAAYQVGILLYEKPIKIHSRILWLSQ